MNDKNNNRPNNKISRRTFIDNAAAGSAFIALGPLTNLYINDFEQADSWPADAPEFRFPWPHGQRMFVGN